jgi:hypothetical protein
LEIKNPSNYKSLKKQQNNAEIVKAKRDKALEMVILISYLNVINVLFNILS